GFAATRSSAEPHTPVLKAAAGVQPRLCAFTGPRDAPSTRDLSLSVTEGSLLKARSGRASATRCGDNPPEQAMEREDTMKRAWTRSSRGAGSLARFSLIACGLFAVCACSGEDRKSVV